MADIVVPNYFYKGLVVYLIKSLKCLLIFGFKDVGDLTCSGFLDGADEGQTECYTLLNSGETKACQIIFPTKIGKTWSFNASVIRFSTGAEVGGAVTFEMTLAVTGQPTLAATTKP